MIPASYAYDLALAAVAVICLCTGTCFGFLLSNLLHWSDFREMLESEEEEDYEHRRKNPEVD